MKNLMKSLAVVAMAITGSVIAIELKNDELTIQAFNVAIASSSSHYEGAVVNSTPGQWAELPVGSASATIKIVTTGRPKAFGVVEVGNGYQGYYLKGSALVKPCEGFAGDMWGEVTIAPNETLIIPVPTGAPAGTELFTGYLQLVQ